METEEVKNTGTTFKKKTKVRIGIAAGLLLVAIAVAVMVMLLVVKKDETSTHAKFISVESSGLIRGKINVTVRYRGNDDCAQIWLLSQIFSDSFMQNAGSKQKISDREFETSVQFEHAQTKYVYLRIYCGEFSSTISLDVRELAKQATVQEDIPDTSKYLFTLTNPERNAATGDIKVVLRMNEPVNVTVTNGPVLVTDKSVRIFAFVDGLNTSSTPYSIFEIFDDNKEVIRIKRVSTEYGNPNIEIIVSSTVARYGGIIYPSVTKYINNGFVQRISHWVLAYMESTETGEVVPKGSFGIYRPLQEESPAEIFTNKHSLLCFVMGSPIPTVELMVSYPNKTKTTFGSTKFHTDPYTFLGIINVDKDHFPDGGIFTCRATLGSETQTLETHFRFREPEYCSIKGELSGIIEQTNKHDMVQCTATGLPAPDIRVTLYDNFGPDLLRIPDFKVSKTKLDEKTVSVNLTISPVNTDIHTVYCVCEQNIFPVNKTEANQRIVLHPGNQYIYNRTLINKFNSIIYGIP